MLSLILGVALAASPQSITVAFPDAKGVNVDVGVVAFLGEHFAQELKREGLKVVTTREMSALLGMERQRQVLGCGDATSSCMAELASALGADVVMLTDLARLGDVVRLNVKAIAGKDGKTLSLYSDRVKDDDAAAESLTRAARQMAGELRQVLRGESASGLGSAQRAEPVVGAGRRGRRRRGRRGRALRPGHGRLHRADVAAYAAADLSAGPRAA